MPWRDMTEPERTTRLKARLEARLDGALLGVVLAAGAVCPVAAGGAT